MESIGPPQADPSPTVSRKALLLAFENAGFWRPFFALLVDLCIFGAGVALVVMETGLGWKLAGSALITAGIVRLFLIGHDACHGSFFKSPLLNDIFGRVAFLPSMTAFSLWDVGHNVAHHGFNNLKGRDQVWAPFSKEEFDALPGYRRVLERIYRSGLGWGLYYFVELWWKKLYFATRRQIGASRAKYHWDSALVTVSMGVWITLVAIAAYETDQNVWLLLALGVFVPFAIWNAVMGFVVFVHHTHPSIAWFHKRPLAALSRLSDLDRAREIAVRSRSSAPQHHGAQRPPSESAHPDVFAASGAAHAGREVPGQLSQLPHDLADLCRVCAQLQALRLREPRLARLSGSGHRAGRARRDTLTASPTRKDSPAPRTTVAFWPNVTPLSSAS